MPKKEKHDIEPTGPVEPTVIENDAPFESAEPIVYLGPIEDAAAVAPVLSPVQPPVIKTELVKEKTEFKVRMPEDHPSVIEEAGTKFFKPQVNGKAYGPYQAGVPVDVDEAVFNALSDFQWNY
jgi:hypothetical protein